MSAFRFSLQKALEWRQMQLEMAEAQLQQKLAAVAEVDRARLELDAAGKSTELQVRAFLPLAGDDLRALGGFRLQVKKDQQSLTARREECQKEIAVRQAAMLEARRRCRLLERLKQRRLTEWESVRNKELEDLASDSYLAQFARRRDVPSYNEKNDS